jgi:hypothetical protein
MKDYPSRLRTGLSSLLTYTLIKYNHSRLYGQSLDLNLHDPNPRIMTAEEHREDKEGECFVHPLEGHARKERVLDLGLIDHEIAEPD